MTDITPISPYLRQVSPPSSSGGRPRRLGDHGWQERAVCRTAPEATNDPELFFPDADDDARVATAKALCAGCPVREICLQTALESGARDGIWGGTTEEERADLHHLTHHRLDPDRVHAALAGRDIHLSFLERRALVHLAVQHCVTPERLAYLLKVSEAHAERLLRAAHRQHRQGRRRSAVAPVSAGRPVGQPELGRAA
ncbi:WhiB family transcriptional regulator [Streptomyces triticirhizae]|uniref:Transcriptional regulator WhiB n=1 Tax=Streptomyces triticirhizae TaxID=2483353 RepID=A0A3M2MB80_9ACTN|nr:WhiB family transcriptional regulator [Streptomyces triticirhizae]RMI46726.1 WhiB family transcriptional regulator [Streptomyces triticirhizae]